MEKGRGKRFNEKGFNKQLQMEISITAIVNKQFTPASMALNHLQKDLKLAINFADTIEQPLPLAAASNEMFKEAKRLGLGARDISAVYIKADYTSFRNGDL